MKTMRAHKAMAVGVLTDRMDSRHGERQARSSTLDSIWILRRLLAAVGCSRDGVVFASLLAS